MVIELRGVSWEHPRGHDCVEGTSAAWAELHPEVRRGVHFGSGGQPGHRAAWLDDDVTTASSDFFRDTLANLDHAYPRPRYHGFMECQEDSGKLVHQWLADGTERADWLLDRLDAVYQESAPAGKA